MLGRPGLEGSHLTRRALLLGLCVLLASAPLSLLLAGSTWLVIPGMAVLCVIGSGVLLRLWLRAGLVPLLQMLVIALQVLVVEHLQQVSPQGEGFWAVLAAQPAIIREGLEELAGAHPPVVLQPHGAVIVLLLISLVVLGLDLMFLELGWHTPTALVLMGFILAPALQQPLGGPWWTALGPVLAGLLILTARTLHADPSYLEGDQRPQAGPLAQPTRTGTAVAVCTVLVVLGALPLSRALPQTAPARVPLSIDVVNQWQGREVEPIGPVMIDDSVSVRRDLLRGEEREVLRYTTTAEEPSYLRLHAMHRYEDGDFVASAGMPSRRRGPEPPFSSLREDGAPVDPATEELARTAITVGDLGGTLLPLPQNVRGVSTEEARAIWAVEGDPGQVMVRGDSGAAGLAYEVLHEQRTSTPEQLRAVPEEQLRMPLDAGVVRGEIPQAAEVLADQLVQEAGAENAYDTAVAFQEHFRDSFAYSLTVRTPPGEEPVAAFLEDGVGYCEQFAATFALMMTSQGYPTRVAIGFTAGEQDGEQWSVTNHNAHAWPEVWFGPEHGWVPFEPTPAAAANGVQPPRVTDPDQAPVDDTADDTQDTPTPEVEETSAPAPEPTTAAPSEDPAAPTPAPGTGEQGAETGGNLLMRSVWLLLAALGLTVAAVAGLRWWSRRRRIQLEDRWQQAGRDGPQAQAQLAWEQLQEAVVTRRQRVQWLGWTGRYGRPPVALHLDPALPPDEALASLLVQARGGGILVEEKHRAAARSLGRAIHEARYAPVGPARASAEGSAPGRELRGHVAVLRELLEARPRR